MTSIFATALGADFERLHPMLRRRFGVGITTGYACVGTGVMSSVRRGPWWTLPFLHLGAARNILFPDQGRDVPFTIENFPYVDPFGRETVTFVREYLLGSRARRFDATMIADRGAVIDYLGTHQHLAVDLELTVEDDGSLSLTSTEQRFSEGPIAFRFPRLLTGQARLRESFDDDAGVYRISVEVRNPVLGFLFGYEGTFTCEFPKAADAPDRLKPVRHEVRT
ncbi:DUF4166 domain-containing protein [Cellulomonas sp. ATA003]|uniref:DUF4166 domain-containing protein n=1 Tax=Cellulomonas sp. ATA003 TaxID=3073064 RepID=UPI0028736A20|nr:DUF4166 domain-containing protein [Cellulomonas sp. ATA003]WNB84585.1 DUF4166 domain-containing protein [Cellulomonas sp. ATA003]